jgi:hypothetical protein
MCVAPQRLSWWAAAAAFALAVAQPATAAGPAGAQHGENTSLCARRLRRQQLHRRQEKQQRQQQQVAAAPLQIEVAEHAAHRVSITGESALHDNDVMVPAAHVRQCSNLQRTAVSSGSGGMCLAGSAATTSYTLHIPVQLGWVGNITAHSLFTDWGALANAAGELRAALTAALQGGRFAAEQTQGRVGPGSSSSSSSSSDRAMAGGSSSRRGSGGSDRGSSGSSKGGSSGRCSGGGSSGVAISNGGCEGSSLDAWQQTAQLWVRQSESLTAPLLDPCLVSCMGAAKAHLLTHLIAPSGDVAWGLLD